MDVAKVIRILGYIVYAILWSPVILIVCIVFPVWLWYKIKDFGFDFYKRILKDSFKNSIMHDVNFIKTGIW